jgi:hypothetical protein
MADDIKNLTPEEAKRLLSEIARTGEGASQIRALLTVIQQESVSAGLPEPLSDAEVIDRLARMIKAAGPTASQIAYRTAFPHAQRPVHHAGVKVTESDVAPVDALSLPRNLRELYRAFPEIKKPGVPVGFPIHQGIAVQKEWCQKAARRMLLDREQKRVDMISIEALPEESPEATDV